VCSDLEVDFAGLSKDGFGVESRDNILGVHRFCYFGYACDKEIRYMSSSGGVIKALLVYALERGIIDAALVTWMSPAKVKSIRFGGKG
jgi:coenzyme F420 hydrogenase subunit beta